MAATATLPGLPNVTIASWSGRTMPEEELRDSLAFLAHKLSVAQSETMAIGDNDNDADMVAWAGLGAAVGNASPKVMQAAQYIALPMEQDGAAEAIERFILAERHA